MLVLTCMVFVLFLPPSFSYLLEDECDMLHGQGCICNMSQVLEDLESILLSPSGIRFPKYMSDVSIRIAQYKCKAFNPLPRGFDITLLTAPSRVAGLPNDTDRQSISIEEFNKAIYEYTIVDNGKIVIFFCVAYCVVKYIPGVHRQYFAISTCKSIMPHALVFKVCTKSHSLILKNEFFMSLLKHR